MTPVKWEIWLVDMPFEEGIGSKVRPALVLGFQNKYIVVGKMTTHPPRKGFPYEYKMLDWQGAGLACQTTLRLSKTIQLDGSRFRKKIGTIQPMDQINVRQILMKINSGKLH